MAKIEFSQDTRPAAVAGTFYPRDSQDLAKMLQSMLTEAEQNQTVSGLKNDAIKTVIVPHAGYIYSGPIAASAYHYLKQSAVNIDTVIVLGPAHRVAVQGCACPSARWFETPLGKIPIAQNLIQQLVDKKLLHFDDQAHQYEHSLEVHLPFLQTIYSEFSLVPLLVGNCEAQTIVDIINHIWTDTTLLVVSTDLSHFLDYDSAKQRDRQTSIAIEHLDYRSIGPEDACGCVPLSGILLRAQQQGLNITTVDRRNSGDTAGDKSRVVGYGAYIVSANSETRHHVS